MWDRDGGGWGARCTPTKTHFCPYIRRYGTLCKCYTRFYARLRVSVRAVGGFLTASAAQGAADTQTHSNR